jgi:hypothetical protein
MLSTSIAFPFTIGIMFVYSVMLRLDGRLGLASLCTCTIGFRPILYLLCLVQVECMNKFSVKKKI